MPDETKVGRRNSAVDLARIQAAHDTLAELGAECIPPPEVDKMPMASLPDSDALVYFGTEVKLLGMTPEGNPHVGGYLVRFSSESDPDLTGDYFTKDTDFGLDEGETQAIPIYFNHGQPMKSREGGDIVITRKIGKGRLEMDDTGLLIDAILFNRDEYEQAIAQMVKSLGWSSGALSHLVEREYTHDYKLAWIKRWIIGEGSLTPTPAEPRNSAIPLKSLIEVPAVTEQPVGEPEVTGDVTASGGSEVKAVTNIVSEPISQEVLKMENSPDTQEMISKAVDVALKAFAEKLPTNGNGGVSVTKDEADQPWESQGQYFKAVAVDAITKGRQTDPRLLSVKAPTGLGEFVPADGGYLIPPQYAPGLIENIHNGGQILSRVRRIPVTSNRLILNAVDETSRVDGSRNGGIRGYWVEEAGSITASKPKFRQIDLKLNKVAAIVYATEELLADQTALGGFLSAAVPDELRFKVEDAILNGNGVGKPQGILNSNALVTFVRDTSLLIAHTDIVAMWARKAPGYQYVWLANQEVMPALNSMVLASSTEIPLRFVDYGPDGVLRMFGAPVIESEHCAAYKDQGDLVLAALSNYAFIESGGVEAASSIHLEFLTDQQIFRFTYRCDGASLWSSALTPAHGSATVSPFVALTSGTT